MKPWKSLIALAALALVLPLTVRAQPGDPSLGTWQLNVAKSKFDPGPAPKSETRTYAQTPAGIQMAIQGVTATGDTQTAAATYKRDGKPYPETGNPDWDAIAVKRVSPLEVKVDLMRAGKIIGHVKVVVSKDHKTKTYHTAYTRISGQVVHVMEVFDRQ